jgi:hypothetical protein
MSAKDEPKREWSRLSILLVLLGVGITLLAIGSYFQFFHYIRALAFMRMFPFNMHRLYPSQPMTNATITVHWHNFAMQHQHGNFGLHRFGTRIPLTFTIYQTLIAIAGLAVAAIGLGTLRKKSQSP